MIFRELEVHLQSNTIGPDITPNFTLKRFPFLIPTQVLLCHRG